MVPDLLQAMKRKEKSVCGCVGVCVFVCVCVCVGVWCGVNAVWEAVGPRCVCVCVCIVVGLGFGSDFAE